MRRLRREKIEGALARAKGGFPDETGSSADEMRVQNLK
jgi:hypothetical protein